MIMIREPEGVGDDPHARFRRGQLVRHVRYGYRGVVVDYDLRCEADAAWYAANKTQPSRDQPWYHVLVHGTTQATYAAQENLAPDPSCAPVAHPLLRKYFSGFEGGAYVRNQRPWSF